MSSPGAANAEWSDQPLPPPSPSIPIDCEPSISWQHVAEPSGTGLQDVQPPLLQPMSSPPPPPPLPPLPPPPRLPEHSNTTDNDVSSETLDDWGHVSFREIWEFYTFRRNVINSRGPFKITMPSRTAIEFLSLKHIENNFKSMGLNQQFDKNNVMEAKKEFDSFENWFARKQSFSAAKKFMSSIRLPLFCHLYMCIYSDHNCQHLHLLLKHFKYLFISSKGAILFQELMNVTENQSLPLRLQVFRKTKFVYQVSAEFFVHLNSFFKYHPILRMVFQEWFDVYFTTTRDPFAIYEEYYNKILSKINNQMLANAPKLNEFPKDFPVNTTKVCKNVLDQFQNLNNDDTNNLYDNQQPSTSKEYQDYTHQESHSREYQSDDVKADDHYKTDKKRLSHFRKSTKNKSSVKRKRKKYHRDLFSSSTLEHKSCKKFRCENKRELIQENKSTIHQVPRKGIILRIGKSNGLYNIKYYKQKDKKDCENEETKKKQQERVNKEKGIQYKEKVNVERQKEVKKVKKGKQKKKKKKLEKDEVHQQKKQLRCESIDTIEFDDSDHSSFLSETVHEDSSECFSSDTSTFYDEEAALRKYVRLKQKHLDQDLRHKTSLFLKTEKITKIELQEFKEDPHLCTITQIVLTNCNKVSCAVLTSDHRYVAAGSSDSIIYIWERSNLVTTLQQSFDILNNIESRMNQNLSPLPSDCTKNLVETLDKSKAFALRGHGGPIYDLVEIAKAKVLLSASNDKTIRIWDLKSKLCLEVYNAHDQSCWCITACPTTLQVVTGSSDGVSCLWYLNYKSPIRIFVGHLDDVMVVKFHPNQAIIASGSSDKTIRIYDLMSGECQRVLMGHKEYISFLEFHPMIPYLLASASGCGEIMLWNLHNSKLLWKLQVGNGSISGLSWSTTNILLALLTTGIILKCDINKNYVNSSIKVKGFSTSCNRLMHLSIQDSLVYTIGVSGKSKFQNRLKIKQSKIVSKPVENEKDLRSEREMSLLSTLFFNKHTIKNNVNSLKPLKSLDSALLDNSTCDFLKTNLQQSSSNVTTNDVSKLNFKSQSKNVDIVSNTSKKIISTEKNTYVSSAKRGIAMTNLSTPEKKVRTTDVQLSQESQQSIQSPSIIIPQPMNNVQVPLQTPTKNLKQHELDSKNVTKNVQQSQLQNVQELEVQKTNMDIGNKYDESPPKIRLTDDLINSMLVPLTEQQRMPHCFEIPNSNDEQHQIPSTTKLEQQDQQFHSVVGSNTNSNQGMIQQLQSNKHRAQVQVEQPEKCGVHVPLQLLNQQSNIQSPIISVPQQLATAQLPNVNVKKPRKQQFNVRSPGVNVSQKQKTVQTTNTIPQQQKANVQSSSVNVSPRQIIVQTTTAMSFTNVQPPGVNSSQRQTIVRTTSMSHGNVQSPSVNILPRKIIVKKTTAMPYANVQSSNVINSHSQPIVQTTNATLQQPQSINVLSSGFNNVPLNFDTTFPTDQIDPKSFPDIQTALMALSRPFKVAKPRVSLEAANSTNSGQNNK